MALRDLKSVIYTDDKGNSYATKIDAAVFAQVDGGGAPIVGGADYAAAPALDPMPRQLRARHVVVSAAGNKRRVRCLTEAAPLFTGAVTTVNLQVLGGAAVAYTRVGPVAESGLIKHDPTQ